MLFAVIAAVALLASGLTFFTGFGLGTLLLPAFAFFFPPAIAVALTAVVHLANGLFKLALVAKHSDKRVALAFGLPAVLAAVVGARLLVQLSSLPSLATYELASRAASITPVKAVIAALMLGIAATELTGKLDRLALDPKWIPAGGVLSGLFGGLSGHQGAFRAAFLAKAGLEPKAFVATSALIAALVDVTRLSVYASGDALAVVRAHLPIVLTGTGAAFAGAYLGSRVLEKVTMRTIRLAVGGLLVVIALALGSGLL